MTKANPSKVWTGVGSGGSTGHPTGRMNPGPFLLSKDQLLVMMVSLGLHVHFGQPAPGGLIIMPPKLLHFKQSQKTIPFQQGKSIIIQNTWGNGKIRHSTMSNQSFRFLKRSLLNISGNWRGKKSSELNFLDAFDALLEVWKFALLEADVLAGLALTRRDCCSVCS